MFNSCFQTIKKLFSPRYIPVVEAKYCVLRQPAEDDMHDQLAHQNELLHVCLANIKKRIASRGAQKCSCLQLSGLEVTSTEAPLLSANSADRLDWSSDQSCVFCYLEETLVRYWCFIQDTNTFGVNHGEFDTNETVQATTDALFPGPMTEISKSGCFWQGPAIVPITGTNNPEFIGELGVLMNSRSDESPYPHTPGWGHRSMFVTVLRGAEESIKEVKLVPETKPHRSKKTVTFNNTDIVHEIPAREGFSGSRSKSRATPDLFGDA